MRIGQNPEKQNLELKTSSIHRIVIPVYIPNLSEPYFKDGLHILKLCLESLQKTVHSKTRISIINNGCCKEVSDYLDALYHKDNYIDQLYLSKNNLGKINALYSIIKSNIEPIVTITDADVLFLKGWQSATENILNDFPEAGMVSPVPSSLGFESKYNNSTIYYGLFRGKIKFSKVLNPEGLLNFERSIERKMYSKYHIEQYLTVNNNKNKAVLGCGHFVATFRSEVFEHAPSKVCQVKIVGGSENKYLDVPNDVGGFLRLATLNNFAYHLGNVKEEWMQKIVDELSEEEKPQALETLSKAQPLMRYQYLIGKVLYKLLFKKFKKQYFKFKGLSKRAAEHY